MSTFDDELEELAEDVMDGLGSDRGIAIKRVMPASYSATTQALTSTVETYSVTRFLRSASRRVFTGSKWMEEFEFEVTLADLVAAGWASDGSKPLDEHTTVTDGAKVYPVVAVERQVGEEWVRLRVRTDQGRQV